MPNKNDSRLHYFRSNSINYIKGRFNIMTKFKEEANKRYYLHSKIKKEGYLVNARERTIFVPQDKEITDSIKKLVNNYGYNAQIEII